MERRTCKRLRKGLKVSWKVENGCFEGITKDVCPGGVFVITEQPTAPKSTFDIAVWVDEESPLNCHAEVVWVNERQVVGYPAGFGARFLGLSPNSVDSILALCGSRDQRCARCMYESE
jgi:hypothetical protein